MKIVTKGKPISQVRLTPMATKMYGSLVKAVVDIELEIMVIDADLHADQEKYLVETGSTQKNLWGINLYPHLYGQDGFIEFDSMINLRPVAGNFSRGVDDEMIQQKIRQIIGELVCD